MSSPKSASLSVNAYISVYSGTTLTILKKIRSIIRKTAPTAIESISYGMPAYKLNGKPLVYFGAWKNHIGFYATPAGNSAFKKELAAYQGAKGSVRFPLDKPIPYDLIKKIVAFRVKQLSKA